MCVTNMYEASWKNANRSKILHCAALYLARHIHSIYIAAHPRQNLCITLYLPTQVHMVF